MVQPVHKIHITEHSDMQLQHICTLYCMYSETAMSIRTSSRRSIHSSSKYKQHCWVEYDGTGGVRQLIKCPTCFCCAHGVSHKNSLNNANNNNNNRIFGLNILCVIQVTVSAWTVGAELEA